MFDSPLSWCLKCRRWVAIDQSIAECARQNGCTPGACPLEPFLAPPLRAAAEPMEGPLDAGQTGLDASA